MESPVKSIDDVIAEHGLPLTVRLKRNIEGQYAMDHPEGEWHTIQAFDHLALLFYKTKNNEITSMNMKSIRNVPYVMITNKTVFSNFSEIYRKYKRPLPLCGTKKCGWFVCTEGDSQSGLAIPTGQVFRIIRFSRCASECTGRSVKIKMYPSKQTFWLACSLTGKFQQCQEPSEDRVQDLGSLLRECSPPFPLVRLREDDSIFTYIADYFDEKILITCTLKQDTKVVQVFPFSDVDLITISSTQPALGILDERDLIKVRTNDLLRSKVKNHVFIPYTDINIDENSTHVLSPTLYPKHTENVYSAVDGEREDYETVAMTKKSGKNNRSNKRHTPDILPRRTYPKSASLENNKNNSTDSSDNQEQILKYSAFECSLNDSYEVDLSSGEEYDEEDEEKENINEQDATGGTGTNDIYENTVEAPVSSDDDDVDDYENTTIVEMNALGKTKKTNSLSIVADSQCLHGPVPMPRKKKDASKKSEPDYTDSSEFFHASEYTTLVINKKDENKNSLESRFKNSATSNEGYEK